MRSKAKGPKSFYKSAKTGTIVSPQYAATHPATTYKQTLRKSKSK